jgi:hypothetical protein
MSECSVCERHGSCTRCINALRAGAIEAEARMYVVIEDNEALRAERDKERALNDLLVEQVKRAEAERDALQREFDVLVERHTEQCFLVEAAGTWYDANSAKDKAASVDALRKEVESLRAFFTERDGPPPDPLALPEHTQKLLDTAPNEQECPQHFGCLPERCETCPEREQGASSAGVES